MTNNKNITLHIVLSISAFIVSVYTDETVSWSFSNSLVHVWQNFRSWMEMTSVSPIYIFV